LLAAVTGYPKTAKLIEESFSLVAAGEEYGWLSSAGVFKNVSGGIPVVSFLFPQTAQQASMPAPILPMRRGPARAGSLSAPVFWLGQTDGKCHHFNGQVLRRL
jgi:hypothetical protein